MATTTTTIKKKENVNVEEKKNQEEIQCDCNCHRPFRKTVDGNGPYNICNMNIINEQKSTLCDLCVRRRGFLRKLRNRQAGRMG